MEDRVRQKGTVFIANLIRQPQTQDAVVTLLKNILKDQRFLTHSSIWATSTLKEMVISDEIIDSTKILFEKILRTDDILHETVQMLKYVMEKPESVEIMSEYSKKVFLRSDVVNSVSDLMAAGAYQGLADPETVHKFAVFMIKVVNEEEVRSGVLDTFVYKPIKNFFTFF